MFIDSADNKIKIIEKEIFIIMNLNNIMKDALLYREDNKANFYDFVTVTEIIKSHIKNITDLF